MYHFFYKIKHWQYFIIAVAIPLVITIYIQISAFIQIIQSQFKTVENASKNFDSNNINAIIDTQQKEIMAIQYAQYPTIITVASVSSILTFVYLIGITLGTKNWLPQGIKPNYTLYLLSIVAIVCLQAYNVYYYQTDFFHEISTLLTYQNYDILELNRQLLIKNIPALLLLPFIIYCNLFTAKLLKTILSHTNPKFKEYLAEFAFLMILPIGIWILQPQLNNLISRKTKSPTQP